MQVPFIFFNNGSGWKTLTPHENTVAALAAFSIQWGTDSPPDQPEPGVMTFTLLDRSGELAGAALDLSGARVILQLSPQPTWGALSADMGTWGEQTSTLATLHQAFTPSPSPNVNPNAITLFDGIISNGGTVTAQGDYWLLELSATSRMLLWKRLQSHGPTSTAPKEAGLHWVGSTLERIAEMRRRAAAAGAPDLSTAALWRYQINAPYSEDDNPDQLTVLHRTFASDMRLPLWFEYPQGDHSELRPLCLANEVTIGLATDGRAYALADGQKRPAFNGNNIIGSLSLDIPEPVTQIVIKGKSVKASDGKLEFSDADVTCSDENLLPANLTTTQSSVTLDADVLVGDESGGLWTEGTPWRPDAAIRDRAAQWLLTTDSRLKPSDIELSSDFIDPATFPWLFWTAPSGPILMVNTAMSNLTGSDARPAFSGAYTTVGGTLTFRWRDDTPVLTHEVTLAPLPPASATILTWSGFEGNHSTWADMTMTLAELSIISTVDTESE